MSHPITFDTTIPDPFQGLGHSDDHVAATITAQIGYDEGERVDGKVVVPPTLWAEIREVVVDCDPRSLALSRDAALVDVRSQLSEATIETLEAEALAEDGARADSGDPHEDDPGF